MRRILSILMVTIALIALQGGKYAYYLACKWQATIVWQLKNCDCEKHLSNADEEAQQSSSAAQLALKEQSIGVFSVFQFLPSRYKQKKIHCFAAYNSFLQIGFVKITERPPSIFIA